MKLNYFRSIHIKWIEGISNKSLIKFNVEEKRKVLSRKTVAKKNSGWIDRNSPLLNLSHKVEFNNPDFIPFLSLTVSPW